MSTTICHVSAQVPPIVFFEHSVIKLDAFFYILLSYLFSFPYKTYELLLCTSISSVVEIPQRNIIGCGTLGGVQENA